MISIKLIILENLCVCVWLCNFVKGINVWFFIVTVKQHLIGNKSRNLQIREDFPCAKSEQEREAEEAARLHQELLLQQYVNFFFLISLKYLFFFWEVVMIMICE